MKVVFIDPLKWDYDVESPLKRPLGGSQSALCYLSVALANLGHQVSLICGTRNPRTVLGVACYSSNNFPFELLRECDVAVVVNGPCEVMDELAPMLGKSATTVLWTGHAPDQPALRTLVNPRMRGLWDQIVCVSEWHRSAMIEAFELSPATTIVLRNAIAPAFEGMFNGFEDFTRAKRERPVLVYNSTPFRGLDVLIELFPAVRQRQPEAQLHVYSSMAVYSMGAETDRYEYLYDRCRATKGISYIGSLPQLALASELREAQILAYPSTFLETSCIAVMEAMAAGLHVVTTRLGALPETTLGFASLVDTQRPGGDRDFVVRYQDALIETLQIWQRDPDAFLRRQWVQVHAINQSATWAHRAVEWESAIRGFH